MYELFQLSEHDYYVSGPTNIGIIKVDENDVVLIDSGGDKEPAKKVLKHLAANNWNLKAIYNTHSHADHIGGNKYLQEKTGCRAYLCGIECTYTNVPSLEPAVLYGGFPYKDLLNKFLLAEKSNAEELTADNIPDGWQIIHLPGHCFDMVGFITADGNAFIGDSVSSKLTIEKYGLTYLWDYKKCLESMELLKTLKAQKFIPSHAEVCSDITELADYNTDAVKGVVKFILETCKDPCSFEDLLQKIFIAYNMRMNPMQYVLIGSTVRSYISGLYAENKLATECSDQMMYWKTV